MNTKKTAYMAAKLLKSLIGIIMLLIVVIPLLWLVTAGFKTQADIQRIPIKIFPSQITVKPFIDVWFDRTGMGSLWFRYFFNTTKIALITTVFVISLGTMIGYGLARYKLRGSSVILNVLLIAQLFSGPALMIPVYVVISKMGLYDTHTGLILAYLIFQTPFAAWLSYSNFQNLPRELEQAAFLDGCSPLGAFIRVTLPLSRISISTVGLMSLLLTWSEYPYSVALLENQRNLTISIGLARFISAFNIYWNQMAAASVIVGLPILFILVFTQRYFVQGMMAGAIK
jgi:multiple sugar transport system permease protein